MRLGRVSDLPFTRGSECKVQTINLTLSYQKFHRLVAFTSVKK